MCVDIEKKFQGGLMLRLRLSTTLGFGVRSFKSVLLVF